MMYRSKYGMVAKSQVEDDIEQICGSFDNLTVGRVKRYEVFSWKVVTACMNS